MHLIWTVIRVLPWVGCPVPLTIFTLLYSHCLHFPRYSFGSSIRSDLLKRCLHHSLAFFLITGPSCCQPWPITMPLISAVVVTLVARGRSDRDASRDCGRSDAGRDRARSPLSVNLTTKTVRLHNITFAAMGPLLLIVTLRVVRPLG